MEKGNSINNTMNIGGSVTRSQIQQGNINSTQTMKGDCEFSYEKNQEGINKIKKSMEIGMFEEEFGEQADTARKLVEETAELVQKKANPNEVKKALSTIKDLAIGVTGSLIASGIAGIILQLPIW